MNQMIQKVNHIGIAVNSIEEMTPFYRDQLGLCSEGVEVVESQKVKVAFFQAGETRIELLEPTADDSPIAVFLAKKGPGVHHVAYQVDDLEAELSKMQNEGVQLIDKTPRQGAHNTQIAFLHPKSGGGVLIELCQSKDNKTSSSTNTTQDGRTLK
jgi:methylmalonyl-CoA/ethylmalonyl-CoA epimerase